LVARLFVAEPAGPLVTKDGVLVPKSTDLGS
jgi:hypothetical protein